MFVLGSQCDDMDIVLGGVNATPQVKHLIGDGGATASNYFVSSPKCTPSRSAWLSGRHYHNLRPNGAKTGKGLNTTAHRDIDAVFPTLRQAGYKTGIFGKIHNNQAGWLCNPGNITDAFDHIETECSPCGGYYRTGKNAWVKKETHDDVTELFTLWRHLSAQEASEALRRPDFVVAVQADKVMQLPKLLELDRSARERMKQSSEMGLSMLRLSA